MKEFFEILGQIPDGRLFGYSIVFLITAVIISGCIKDTVWNIFRGIGKIFRKGE